MRWLDVNRNAIKTPDVLLGRICQYKLEVREIKFRKSARMAAGSTDYIEPMGH